MQYKLKIENQIYAVTASARDENGQCSISVNGESREAIVRAVADRHFHLLSNGRTVNLFVAGAPEGTWVWVDGRARVVQDTADEQRHRTKVRGDTPREVTPPTPATVVRVLAAAGERVDKGQGLVVVSAMKMEMTLTAPYSGTVTAVRTKVGAKVSPGEILVEIEPETEDASHE